MVYISAKKKKCYWYFNPFELQRAWSRIVWVQQLISDVAGFVNDEASSVESAAVKLHSDDGEDEDTKEDQDADL